MRNFIITVLMALALVACGAQTDAEAALGGGTNVHNHSGGGSGGSTLNLSTIALSGSITSTKACASGYTRVGPNLCWIGGNAMTALVRDACTTITAPSGAKALIYNIFLRTVSANATGLRGVQVRAYDSVVCVYPEGDINFDSREQVAVIAETISQHTVQMLTPITTGQPKLLFSDDLANTSEASYRIIGYLD